MSTYRVEWPCGDVTETDAWQPNECPVCEAAELRANAAKWLEAAEQGERTAVVAWLRVPCGAHYFADAIERGDHIRRAGGAE